MTTITIQFTVPSSYEQEALNVAENAVDFIKESFAYTPASDIEVDLWHGTPS